MSYKYQWLLFDLDNTLLDFNASSKIGFKSLIEKINPKLDWESLYPIYRDYNHQVWDEREAGLISHNDLKTKRWRLFFDHADIEFDPSLANDHYFYYIKNKPFLIEGAIDLLRRLKGDYRMMIITNGLSEVQWNRLRIMKMESYFEHIIISDEINATKPEFAFFDHCDKLMVSPDKSEVLVIGDTLKSDIKGANDFGYISCWYNYYQTENDSDIEPDYTVQSLADLARDVLEINLFQD